MKKRIPITPHMVILPNAKKLMTNLRKWYKKLLTNRACTPPKGCMGSGTSTIGVNPFVACFNTYGKTDNDKAFILLVGKETWYRGCHCWTLQMNISLRNIVLKIIEAEKPWTKTNAFSNFENLYNYVESFMRMPGISQLYIYDVALRLTWLDGRKQILPDKKVYVHAKPMLGLKELIKKGVFCGLTKSKGNEDVIERKILAPWFGKMTAVQIEDILCHIGKSYNRKKKGIPATNQIDRKLDNILP